MESKETGHRGQARRAGNPDPEQIGYRVIRLRSWDLAKAFLSKLPRDDRRPGGHLFWCFRGQPNASWGLSTTLERDGLRYGCPSAAYAERERRRINEFRERVRFHGGTPALSLRDIDVLALVQHYGGSTRLLDFTYSWCVACFFALLDAEDDAAVWVVNARHVRKGHAERLQRSDLRRPSEFNCWALTECDRALDPASIGQGEGVLLVQPHSNPVNARLAAQKGLFLFPLDVTASFEDNLESALDLPDHALAQRRVHEHYSGAFKTMFHKVLKVILPKEIHRAAMSELHQMDVTSASLFPGQGGSRAHCGGT